MLAPASAHLWGQKLLLRRSTCRTESRNCSNRPCCPSCLVGRSPPPPQPPLLRCAGEWGGFSAEPQQKFLSNLNTAASMGSHVHCTAAKKKDAIRKCPPFAGGLQSQPRSIPFLSLCNWRPGPVDWDHRNATQAWRHEFTRDYQPELYSHPSISCSTRRKYGDGSRISANELYITLIQKAAELQQT